MLRTPSFPSPLTAAVIGLVLYFPICGSVSATPKTSLPQSAHIKSNAWITGSWVNVRNTPRADAEVIAQLVVNTAIHFSESETKPGQEYCAIEWSPAEKDEAKTHTVQGFVACRFIGKAPLTIETVGPTHIKNDAGKFPELLPNPQYSATRAFWLQPSFARLTDAGAFFYRTMLPAKQRQLEMIDENFVWEKRPPLKRFPIPEFEAMKTLMANGVTAAPILLRDRLVPWKTIQTIINSQATVSTKMADEVGNLHDRLFYEGALRMLKQISLPPASVSAFTDHASLMPPRANAEQLSAGFQIPYYLKVLSGPFWSFTESGGARLVGWWDIGKYEHELQTAVYSHGILSDGTVRSQTTTVKNPDWNAGCREGFRYSETKNLKRIGSSDKDRTAIVHFFSPAPLTHSKVKLERSALQSLQFQESRQQRHEQFTQGQLHRIDINHDGIADLAVWEAWHVRIGSQTNKPEPAMRISFVNVNGQWYLLEVDEYMSCDD
ncbi:hypothetical protein RF679_13415 [Undibacterium cyanobacteriorum]|uniref:SH3b domain-containing protein n=1 Tax=Undibacterium cyanobacteriorum TaxID=3073561 RepID=A0ABY9RG58_9BURK|nr:hypothetical protein [Undibacterium sp. 20NA77.5]WMW79644.1 hypothetical protein RF679_13415 [Undibacterium sp. 20NA77.5]